MVMTQSVARTPSAEPREDVREDVGLCSQSASFSRSRHLSGCSGRGGGEVTLFFRMPGRREVTTKSAQGDSGAVAQLGTDGTEQVNDPGWFLPACPGPTQTLHRIPLNLLNKGLLPLSYGWRGSAPEVPFRCSWGWLLSTATGLARTPLSRSGGRSPQ